MTGERESVSTVQASKTTFAIIEALSDLGEAGVTELATYAELPKSTVYKHLATLEEIGYVACDQAEYYLTDKLTMIAQGLDSSAENPQITKEVNELSEVSGEIAGIHVAQSGRGVDMYQTGQDSENPDFQNSPYLHSTAPGKAILSQFSASKVDAIVAQHGLPELTENTITDAAVLEEDLERIRERGIAFDREEQEPGIRGIAVPLQRNSSGLIGALYIYGPANRLTSKRFEEHLPGLLLRSKDAIEAALDAAEEE